MVFDEQRRILRQQLAGDEMFRRLKIDAMGAATFEDRLRDFNNIIPLTRRMNVRTSRNDDDIATARYALIRAKYDAANC